MSLERYHQKRDFSKTAEPRGQYNPAAGGRGYIIQKHAASQLHYDFRLQVGGVLKSWAVPKGPSLDPKDKRLAMETEDHPLDYADFEGTIPPDNYGAGTVMLWDRGDWQPLGDVEQGLKKGKLTFELQGERLQGKWALVKMKGRRHSGKEWLLIKENDEFAAVDTDPAQDFQKSVLTQRTMDAIAQDEASVSDDTKTTTADKSDRVQQRTKRRGRATASPQKIDRKLEQLQDLEKSQALGRETASDTTARDLPDAKCKRMPTQFKPQLASLYKSVPEGDDWLHEIKYDGYRLVIQRRSSEGETRLFTRNNKDWTDRFPGIAEAFRSMPEGIVDGELVYLNDAGISSFEDLQSVLKSGGRQRLVFYAFDLPYLEGYDLTQVPLAKRKALLANLVQSLDSESVVFSDHFRGNGQEVWDHACAHGLEGIISKQADSCYEDTRTRSWRKAKCSKRQEFLIIGYTPPQGSREDFGSLLLGYWHDDRLCYAGKVGTGFNRNQLKEIHQQLRALRQKHVPPIENAKDLRSGEVHWVKPKLIAEVEFTEWTAANRLRHPAFVALRADKSPEEITKEVPRDAPRDEGTERKPSAEAESAGERASDERQGTKAIARKRPHNRQPSKSEASSTAAPRGKAVSVAGVRLTSPDKPLYKQAGITKQDLAEYYVSVADWMLPHIARRPLTLVRCPQGHKRHCFYQKHLGDAFDPAVKKVAITEKQGEAYYAYVDSVQGLIGLVQMGTLEVHAWGSRVDNPDKPDTLVFDLDPDEGVTWQAVKEGARHTHELLAELGLKSFLRTSGGKGLHVVVPVTRRHSWDEVKAFSRAVAEELAQRYPEQYIATASKAKRKNKIFIDYLRNSRGATSICNFSTRSRTGAPVAMPISWDELSELSSPEEYGIGQLPERLAKGGADPWEDFHRVRQSITQDIKAKLGLD